MLRFAEMLYSGSRQSVRSRRWPLTSTISVRVEFKRGFVIWRPYVELLNSESVRSESFARL